jgi:hypothetical protein
MSKVDQWSLVPPDKTREAGFLFALDRQERGAANYADEGRDTLRPGEVRVQE